MDIVIKVLYYHLKEVDGRYHIYRREQIYSPMMAVVQLDKPDFDKEEDAERFVKELNEDMDGNTKSVTI